MTAGFLFKRLSSTSTKPTYLHVGPSGDCWAGASIFAAKHLQPDYVRSVLLPPLTCVESLLERLEGDPKLAQQIYDDETVLATLLEVSEIGSSDDQGS
jgi:hypothetical protein